MTKYICRCDKCKSEQLAFMNTIYDQNGFIKKTLKQATLPLGWKEIDGRDLCPDCNLIYETVIENTKKTFWNTSGDQR